MKGLLTTALLLAAAAPARADESIRTALALAFAAGAGDATDPGPQIATPQYCTHNGRRYRLAWVADDVAATIAATPAAYYAPPQATGAYPAWSYPPAQPQYYAPPPAVQAPFAGPSFGGCPGGSCGAGGGMTGGFGGPMFGGGFRGGSCGPNGCGR